MLTNTNTPLLGLQNVSLSWPCGLNESAPFPVKPFVGAVRLILAFVFAAVAALADANVPQASSNPSQTVETTKVARLLKAAKRPIRWVQNTGKRRLASIAKLVGHSAPHNTFVAQAEINRLVQLKQLPAEAPPSPSNPPEATSKAEADLDPSIFGHISEKDLQDARELKPPPTLEPRAERINVQFNLGPRQAFERVGSLFSYKIIFDTDYTGEGNPIRFQMDNANYLETLRALELATGSFVVPLSGTSLMVAKDTPQKRLELEPNVVVVLNLPQATTPTELAELARSVQQSVDLQRMFIDNAQRMIVLRGPISKVRPAQQMYTQMLRATPMVEVGIQLIEFSSSLDASYGMNLQNRATIMRLSNNVLSLNRIGSMTNLLSLSLSNLDLFATASEAVSRSLLNTEIRMIDGMPATLHIGDRYPIATSGYFGAPIPGAGTGNGISYRPPPTFNFEDLGLNIKITPHVNGMDQISLDVEAEFKVISGKSINDIPIISTRKFNTKVSLETGEWAVMAGLLTTNEARTISGFPGLLRIPLLGKALSNNTKNKTRGEALLVLRPRLLSLPASEWASDAIATGPEGRPRIPL